MSFTLLAGVVFFVGYAAIALEHKLHVNKSAIALAVGTMLWLIAAAAGVPHIGEAIGHAGSEIFGIVVFLLAAMSLVEILVHYEFFDFLRGKLFQLGLTERGQFILITALTFFLSAIVDNLTTTIVMVQIARKFFRSRNLLYATAGVIIAANAGGAWSPIGDVTTIMLWFADKITAWEVISRGILPSLTLWVVSVSLLAFKISHTPFDVGNEIVTKLQRSEKTVIGLVFLSFFLPIGMSVFGLPPYIGLLLGLAIVWLCVDWLKYFVPKQSHLDASIDEFIKRTDIPSLKFFIGILLAVSALHALGVLEQLAHVVYGTAPGVGQLIMGNVGLGFLSALLDNVPLTAMAIQILPTTSSSLWVLLALTVGTGGSLLVIGSAAGVVAMGMVKELNFSQYFKIAFVPALLGYLAAVGVWCIQYFWLGW